MTSAVEREVFEQKHFRTAKQIIRALCRTEHPWDKRLLRPDQWGFRGQPNSNWELIPSALRKGTVLGFDSSKYTHISEGRGGCLKQISGEFVAVQQFLESADRVGLVIPGDCTVFRFNKVTPESPVSAAIGTAEWPTTETLELLAVAQHHGVPTRLLDFTFHPLVALYWAAAKAIDDYDSLRKVGADWLAVWGIDLDFPVGYSYEFLVVQVPKGRNAFLRAQQGFFLLDRLRNRDRELEESISISRRIDEIYRTYAERTDRFNVRMIKYTAPLKAAHEIIRLLTLENIDKPHLMPNFDNVVQSLKSNRR